MIKRVCTKCPDRGEQDIDNFSKKREDHETICKSCKNEKIREHYRQNKEFYIIRNNRHKDKIRLFMAELKQTLACIKCGENHPACLSFHHRNPLEKEFEIGSAVLVSMDRLKLEIAKCDVLCMNCHAKLHYNERCDKTTTTGKLPA